MTNRNNLARFIEAQEKTYDRAFQEIRQGRKIGHWMWFIFPQISGLGRSDTSKFYAIKDKNEAAQYLNHPILGMRLVEITSELLNLNTIDPISIFGEVDSLKLKSSMTLFSLVEKSNPIFQNALDNFFKGEKDMNTVQIVNS